MKSNSNKVFIYIAVITLAIGAGFVTYSFVNGQSNDSSYGDTFIWRLDIIYQNPRPFFRHFSPTWRSLKKVTDLYYLPRTWFYTSNLPVYELTLVRADLKKLLDALPPIEGGKPELTEEYKFSVRGDFNQDGVESDARIRYRGLILNHWSARKKSMNITLLDDTGKETTTHRLLLPEDRSWAVASLEAYRMQKFGVLTPKVDFVTLKLNGRDLGVYLEIEEWGLAFLERNNRAIGELFTEKDIENANRPDFLKRSSLDYWTPRIHIEQNPYREALERFLFTTSETTDEEFAAKLPHILDMEKMYGWMLESLLSRDYHQQNTGNLNFYYDPTRDKFEPIGFDMTTKELRETFEVFDNRLKNRILQHEPFRREFETRTRAYVNNQKNLEDDLAYYDRVVASIEKDVIADTAKLPPTATFYSETEFYRSTIITNFEKIRQWLDEGELPITFAEEEYPLTK
ncbi:MAG: Uncharacterized protein G01um101429_465 [Parcubacteria group bacterium Gr01-1014_29]|nr:MAG: Uncharacterized protein G01um101429_465 [Parcubacteria group bacterium Gr01-1014_29]